MKSNVIKSKDVIINTDKIIIKNEINQSLADIANILKNKYKLTEDDLNKILNIIKHE